MTRSMKYCIHDVCDTWLWLQCSTERSEERVDKHSSVMNKPDKHACVRSTIYFSHRAKSDQLHHHFIVATPV